MYDGMNEQVILQQSKPRTPSKPIKWSSIYPPLFFFLIVPGAIAILYFLFSSGNQSRTQVINTPDSPQARYEGLASATETVLQGQISDAVEVVAAADKVIAQQQENLLREKVIELSNAIALGRKNPKHPCYSKEVNECLSLLIQPVFKAKNAAVKVGDLDSLLLIDRQIEAFSRVRTGNVMPGEFNSNLYEAALKQKDKALLEIEANSPDGRAAQLLNEVDDKPVVKGEP